MTAYGIDFGTTNSVLASCTGGSTAVVQLDQPSGEWKVEGFDKVLPSTIAIEPDGGWRFGWKAKKSGTRRLDAAKRLLASDDKVRVGDEEIFVEEAAAALFRRIRDSARTFEGVEFDRAVVTVPANSRGLARYRTKICAGLAGIETKWLLNEPTAAAISFGARLGGDRTVLVVDVGGGTTDVTVLHMTDGAFVEQGSSGVVRLGGIDFDQEILRRLEGQIPGAEAWDTATRQEFLLDLELAKIRLSSRDETNLPIPGQGSRRLTRAEVDGWLAQKLDKIEEPIRNALATAGMTIASVDDLLLVGGSCRMPALRERVEHIVGREAARGVDPMTAVAEGAALASAILAGELDASIHLTIEHDLGVVVLDPNPGESFSVLIHRGQTLPASTTESYVPVTDFQERVDLKIIEGDCRKPLDDDDNRTLDEWSVSLGVPRPSHEAAFDLTYSYDHDGLIHITVTDQATGTELDSKGIGSVKGRDPKDLVAMHAHVDDMASSAPAPEVRDRNQAHEPELPEKVRELLDRARIKVMPMVSESDAAKISQLANALEEAVGTEEQDAAEEGLATFLRAWSYLF